VFFDRSANGVRLAAVIHLIGTVPPCINTYDPLHFDFPAAFTATLSSTVPCVDTYDPLHYDFPAAFPLPCQTQYHESILTTPFVTIFQQHLPLLV
jgi:hypothetical protein